jgi:hypothetical protein
VFKGFTRYTTVFKKPNPNPLTDVTFRPNESVMGDESSVAFTEQMPKHQVYVAVLEHPQLQKTIEIKEGETHVLGRAPNAARSFRTRCSPGLTWRWRSWTASSGSSISRVRTAFPPRQENQASEAGLGKRRAAAPHRQSADQAEVVPREARSPPTLPRDGILLYK